jgi:CRISPR/Cas system CSM-associated protein Csm5 (group 7 of RAMP superfamily)
MKKLYILLLAIGFGLGLEAVGGGEIRRIRSEVDLIKKPMDLRKTKSVGDLSNPKFRAGFEGTEIKASWGNEEVVLNLRVDITEEFRTEKDPETRDVEVRIPRSELPKDKDKPSRLFPVENTSIAIQVLFNPNKDLTESYFSVIKRKILEVRKKFGVSNELNSKLNSKKYYNELGFDNQP